MNRAIDIDKLKAVVLYVISKTNSKKIDFHKLFKIMYFADMEHLAKYGRRIIGDNYRAFPDGPVPILLYTAFQDQNISMIYPGIESLLNSIHIEGFYVYSDQNSDLDELSKSDILCLDKSITDNRELTKLRLTAKSHGAAYKIAWESTSKKNNPISNIDIAAEGGASEGMLRYIEEREMLNQLICNDC